MNIKEVEVNNFRSLSNVKFKLEKYSLLTGPNNSGKSNVIDALRCFYDDLKFDEKRDFPKFKDINNEKSYVEVEYSLDDDEAKSLEPKYLLQNRLRLRRILYPKEEKGIFGYEGESLSNEKFYGWDNLKQGKLGTIIYVPTLSSIDEHTKLTGPSELRDLLDLTLSKFPGINDALTKFNKQVKTLERNLKRDSSSGGSLSEIEKIINEELKSWGVEFRITFNQFGLSNLKEIINPKIHDQVLNTEQDFESYGHGLLRKLIYSLIRISATFDSKVKQKTSSDFSPRLNLLLFEEPELFLHPPQQDNLGSDLIKLAKNGDLQVLASTHSPHFISLNVEQIGGILHLTKTSEGKTNIGQVDYQTILNYIDEVKEDARNIQSQCNNNPAYSDILNDEEFDKAKDFLWFEPDRCNLFFAKHVLIVEGLSEKYMINYLLREGKLTPQTEVFVLDAVGKSHIPMFMNLLNQLRIYHSVLYDDDTNKNRKCQNAVKEIINKSKGNYTCRIESITPNLEGYLDLNVDKKSREKAFKILEEVKKILEDRNSSPQKKKLDSLISKINKLLDCNKKDA